MKAQLQRSMGLADVALFYIIACTNLQWIAASAAAGPASLFAWVAGCGGMFVPLCIVVVFLSSKFPREGGMYVWSTRAFGPFAGFITAWTYWCSTVAFFPSLLYFTAGNALYIVGGSGTHRGSPGYFIAFAVAGVALATGLNVLGLKAGKRLVNVAAICRVSVILILIVTGAIVAAKYGFATHVDVDSLRPEFNLKELIFWSVIAFALTGPESVPFMTEEVRDPLRSIPRGLAIAAPCVVAIYVLGTLGLFAIVPANQTDSLYGVMQGIARASSGIGSELLVVPCAVLVVVSALGSVTAWVGANARLPFVAGIDNYLPPSFGWLHPRWKSPVVSLIVQAFAVAVLVVFGQGGTTVKGAYDVLVSSTVLATMIPFIFVFAAGAKLSEGNIGRIVASTVGLVTTTTALVFAALPAPDDPNKALATLKVIGLNVAIVALGVGLYLARSQNRRQAPIGPIRSEPSTEQR